MNYLKVCSRTIKCAKSTIINKTQTISSPTSVLKNFIRKLHISGNVWAKLSFNLSDIGEGIREVIVKEWYVKVGDKVAQFDNICEVQSDKASVTITSRYDGVVAKLYHDIDGIALVGKPLIDIETDQEKPDLPETTVTREKVIEIPLEISSEIPKREARESVEQHFVADDQYASETLCIPSVRRLAREHNVNLENVKGTGKNDRILKEDVLKYISQPTTKHSIQTQNEVKKTQIVGFQKAMVKTMTESLKIPHFVYSDEINVTKLSELRRELRSSKSNLKISFMPFFIKAVSNALQRYPILNCSVDEKCEHILYHKSQNIGIAMDTSSGLAVPVIKNVQSLGVMDISNELQRLMESGKAGSFLPNDLSGGSFTISNIGSIGGTYTKPVILPPQVAIVAFGGLQVLPRFDESQNVVRQEIINLSGAADHRIVDGATMARFVNTLKRQIELPYLLFLNV